MRLRLTRACRRNCLPKKAFPGYPSEPAEGNRRAIFQSQ